ncbi:hypothetical protein U9M48_039829 [Paspalum notatum var. saurae]|uniref:LRAT domain-containing protein n=1 Tax=Paspalum notatum var. saurae TaxID=547442 RepID=A0AAQ3XBR7_PASNO
MDRGVTVTSSTIQRCQLRPGDHIYSWRRRRGYAHHGIYESDQKVIQYCSALDDTPLIGSSSFRTRPCPECAEAEREGGVVISCLDCFLEGGAICLFAYSVPRWFYTASNIGPQLTCHVAPEDPPEEVLRRANNLWFFGASNGFGKYDYNALTNNCVDFAFYCKTECRLGTYVVAHAAVKNVTKSLSPLWRGFFGGFSTGFS